MNEDLDLPLRGVRVLDLASGVLGEIARQLGELGAEVIRVEPRGGSTDRTERPSVGGLGLGFVAANLNKRAAGLDLADRADREAFEQLLRNADILIEASGMRPQDGAILDVADIRRSHPSLVILSVSGFGAGGAYGSWQATGPVLHALSGELSRSGVPGCAPLTPPGDIAFACAMSQAALVTLIAYVNRLNTGAGDRLDFSLLDGTSQALDPGYGSAGSAAAGVPASQLPRGRAEARHQYPILPCADGYVRLCVLAPRQWRAMFEWMGRPEAFADPAYARLQTRFASKTLMPAIAAFFADKTRAELQTEGQRLGVPIAGVLDLGEALASEQITARGAFVSVELDRGVTALFPDGVMTIDGRRAGVRSPAPWPSEGPIRFTDDELRLTAVLRRTGGERPLSGLRVLDLGVIVVGAEQGRLLADQGAEVIKIETAGFPDGARQTLHGGDISPAFAAGHRNKLGLGLNLRHPEGKALFLKLVKQSDVVLSNFKPGTLESLRLDYATLSGVNPRLIMADGSAFGATGPWSRWLGYGPLVRASAGLTAQWRYPGDPGSFSDALTVYPDHVAARVGVIGVLALLIRRERTGRGGVVSVSQAEVMLSHMATEIAALSLRNAGGPLVEGPEQDAPWGVYPCAGDDEWCVVTVRDDADWRALCGAMGLDDLAADPDLASRGGRAQARDRIDQAVAAWLRVRAAHDAMEQLQHAGVPAGAMLRVSDLPDFAYFKARAFFRRARHPQLAESFYVETAPTRSERLPDPPDGPAPRVGEHTIQIARERLGLDESEIAQLLEAQVLEAPDRPSFTKRLAPVLQRAQP